MSLRAVCCAALLVCLLPLLGCGDDEKDSSRTAEERAGTTTEKAPSSERESISRRTYERRANVICRELVRDALRIRGEDFFAADGRDLSRGFRRLSTAVEQALTRLRGLGVPPGDEDAVARIYTQTESGLAIITRAQRDDGLALRIVRGELNPFTAAARSARAYGLTRCNAL